MKKKNRITFRSNHLGGMNQYPIDLDIGGETTPLRYGGDINKGSFIKNNKNKMKKSKDCAPGEMYNKYQMKKMKQKVGEPRFKNGLRSPDAVVKSEQNASHQFYKKNKKNQKNPEVFPSYGKSQFNNSPVGMAVNGFKKMTGRKKQKTALEVSRTRSGKGRTSPALSESMVRASVKRGSSKSLTKQTLKNLPKAIGKGLAKEFIPGASAFMKKREKNKSIQSGAMRTSILRSSKAQKPQLIQGTNYKHTKKNKIK